ncbi:phospholipase D family protein [Heliobacterium chlorum]|uniref:phospholipase D n=1 Tax=Heliobacterium chlorum TaxID=2698 RepID=A0ABR7T484_HELCL|nr:phospholipase D-like domain-containing protein [Heliobacterium chlorum]MBC9785584.1 phospholipase D family protein [Heliobacterium chlorum]
MNKVFWLSVSIASAILMVSFSLPVNSGNVSTTESVNPNPTDENTPASSVPTPNPVQAQLDWAFTRAGHHPENLLHETIASAKTTLDLAAYVLSHPDMAQFLAEAKNRGVKVRIITDRKEAQKKGQRDLLKSLRKAGVPIKINKHNGVMHLTAMIADGDIVATGSCDYSQPSLSVNDDVLLVIKDPILAQAWKNRFELMWDDEENYQMLP